MRAIGVRELKNKLSEYLRLVKTGEAILVTERSAVVAEIRPADERARSPAGIRAHLEGLARHGYATLPMKHSRVFALPKKRIRLRSCRSRDLLDEERDE